jgi:hypothetical protein
MEDVPSRKCPSRSPKSRITLTYHAWKIKKLVHYYESVESANVSRRVICLTNAKLFQPDLFTKIDMKSNSKMVNLNISVIFRF